MNLIRALFGEKRSVTGGKPAKARYQPAVEGLEDRCLAAVDTFIWFEPPPATQVQGETKDAFYGKKNAFEIKDFSFGVENPSTIGSATGGAGAGKIKFNEFTIKETTDNASPAFFRNVVEGAQYKSVTIEMRKAGGDPTSAGESFLRYRFQTVFTTKIDWSGPGDDVPTETITFVFDNGKVTYQGSRPAEPNIFVFGNATVTYPDSPPTETNIFVFGNATVTYLDSQPTFGNNLP
jgi:type VI protein secretion system component Hcp